MQPWIFAALGAAVLIAVHYCLLRAASGRLPDTFGAFVLEGTAALGIAAYWVLGPAGAAVRATRAGLFYAAASGVAVAGASILLFVALRRGGSTATTGAIALGGGITISAVVAPFAFGEAVTVRRVVGVVLGIAAIVVLSREGAAP